MADLDDDEDVVLKVGDRVNLNTEEGPDMVVSKIEIVNGVSAVSCIWFEDHRPGGNESPIWVLKKEVFPLEVLSILD